MSSGQKACWDDEEDWSDLKVKAGIKEVKWEVYSQCATFAKQLYEKHQWIGERLKLGVIHEVQKLELKNTQAAEVKQFEEYQKLKEKFK